MSNNGNIILNRIVEDNSTYKFKEFIPDILEDNNSLFLSKTSDNISWISIDLSLNLIVNNRFKDTDIYYDKGRIGVGRFPLFNYRFDLATPKDTIMTTFHIGDGSFGFSLGNGAAEGFIPEIIGIGSDKDDAGLYFVGIAGNDKASNIPLIILDGRDAFNKTLTNRPVLGITSGNYNEYIVTVDTSKNLNVNGNISTTDLIISNISLLEIIADLQTQINNLKTKIT